MTLNDVQLRTLSGEDASLYDYMDQALLIVNVASECGLTPQYSGLQRLQERFFGRGFNVLGFPCNQFGFQEPGSSDEIAEFCTTKYSVSFPMFEKLDVKGPAKHPLYQQLTSAADDEGRAGDIEWNFEKFLVSPDLEVVRRFRSMREPDSNTVVVAIKSVLPL
jgi:glutathione peroxidase